MSFNYKFHDDIDLFVKGRITEHDALRQERTAKEILKRIKEQPGLILADEVGMGKTIQALAVCALLWRFNPDARILVLSPNHSVADNWVNEYKTFITHINQMEISDHLNKIKNLI